MVWKYQPALSLIRENQIIMETEPFSGLLSNGLKPAAEIVFAVKNEFSFSVCMQNTFSMSFDECGITLYNQHKRILMMAMTAHDDLSDQMRCTVFHEKQGDICMRDLGKRLNKIYFQIVCRSNMIKVQYSFVGGLYKDLRKFWLNKPGDMQISLYACSPLNNSFDAVFSEIHLEEGE